MWECYLNVESPEASYERAFDSGAGAFRPGQSRIWLSANEAVQGALRLREQGDELRLIQLQELRNRIDRGLSKLIAVKARMVRNPWRIA